MGERLDKTQKKIKDFFIQNIQKNIILISIGIYLVILAIWNIGTLYLIGDIDLKLFLILLIDSFNTPVIIITSLVLTGKYKNAEFNKEALIQQHALDKQLVLAKQEIANLQEIQELNHVIGDLIEKNQRQKEEFKKELEYQNELTTYKILVAAKDGKVPDVVCRVKDWNDSNKTIEILEKSEGPEENAGSPPPSQ